MKKILALILVLCVTLSLPITASAVDEKTIDRIAVTSLPDTKLKEYGYGYWYESEDEEGKTSAYFEYDVSPIVEDEDFELTVYYSDGTQGKWRYTDAYGYYFGDEYVYINSDTETEWQVGQTYSVGLTEPDDVALLCADVNYDGAITVEDVVEINKYIVGLIDSFEL